MKLRKIFKSSQYYCICESDRTAGLVMYVVVGGVLMQEVVVELLPEEEAQFRSAGNLDSLAMDIARGQSQYESRVLRPRAEGEALEFVEAI